MRKNVEDDDSSMGGGGVSWPGQLVDEWIVGRRVTYCEWILRHHSLNR